MNTEQRAYPSAGDVVTVLDWLKSDDRSYVGQPLEVVAVDPPFIAVRCDGNIRPLDMRRVRVMRLSKEYVAALTQNAPRESQYASTLSAFMERSGGELRPAPDSSELWRDIFGGGAK
jgi:hypothetical protein